MSGHSHWAGIKHKKGLEDAKRAKVFGKLARAIVIAAREKGPNPDANPSLRLAIEKAKAANMPAENVERALKRGAGGTSEAALEEFLYEAFSPGGIAVLIEGITDNKNRTLNEIKKILQDHGGRLAELGSVRWMFERKGAILLGLGEDGLGADRELAVIDAGAEEMAKDAGETTIYTAPEKMMEVKRRLEEMQLPIASAGFAYLPKNPSPIPDQGSRRTLEKFLEALDEHDDVQELYVNAVLAS